MKKLLLLLIIVMNVLQIQSCERDASCSRKIPMYRFSFVTPKGPSWWSQIHPYVAPYIIPACGIGTLCAAFWVYNQMSLSRQIAAFKNEVVERFRAVKSELTVIKDILVSSTEEVREINRKCATREDISEVRRDLLKLATAESTEKISQDLDKIRVELIKAQADTTRKLESLERENQELRIELQKQGELALDSNEKITVLHDFLKASQPHLPKLPDLTSPVQLSTPPRFKNRRSAAKPSDATSSSSFPLIPLLTDKLWATERFSILK